MNKKGSLNSLLISEKAVFIFGGLILGFMISETLGGAIIGGIIGFIISSLKHI
jgi:hypothetical protein